MILKIISYFRNATIKCRSSLISENSALSSLLSSAPQTYDGEIKLKNLLFQKFPSASKIEVQDISCGCGAMYNVWIESTDFEGLTKVKQHRLVTQAIREEVKEMHGLRISTAVPENK